MTWQIVVAWKLKVHEAHRLFVLFLCLIWGYMTSIIEEARGNEQWSWDGTKMEYARQWFSPVGRTRSCLIVWKKQSLCKLENPYPLWFTITITRASLSISLSVCRSVCRSVGRPVWTVSISITAVHLANSFSLISNDVTGSIFPLLNAGNNYM